MSNCNHRIIYFDCDFKKNIHNSLSLKWKMNCAIKDFDILKPLPNKNPLANQVIHKGHFFLIVPRAGLEPARLSASVFETDLSTDSNIWAESGCKGNSFFLILQINLQKFCG